MLTRLRHQVITLANAATESAVLQRMLDAGSPTLLPELPPPDAAAPPVEGLALRADPHGALRHQVITLANAATESAVLQRMLDVGFPTLLPELPPPDAAAPPCENPVASPKLPPEPPQPDAPCCAVLRARFPPPRAVAEPPQPGAPPQLGVLRACVPPPHAVAEPPQPDAPPQLDAPPQEAPTKRRTARNRAARNRRKLRHPSVYLFVREFLCRVFVSLCFSP